MIKSKLEGLRRCLDMYSCKSQQLIYLDSGFADIPEKDK